MRRALLLIMDGVGIGALPDAADFGDDGADTLGHVAEAVGGLKLPGFEALGLGNLNSLGGPILGLQPQPKTQSFYGKMQERGGGKDSTAGHWELAGLILEEAFKTFPNGFPAEVMQQFCERAEVEGFFGNKPASGTGIIDEFGAEHLKTGKPIIYTSADPVFQIAAHQDVIPLDRLYRMCEVAFELVVPIGIGRVIARPFVGEPGNFQRTEYRKDFSVAPSAETLLDRLNERGILVYGVGKVDNLFAMRGFDECRHTKDNRQGVEFIVDYLKKTAGSGQDTLIFANLVDFDTQFGHRNDAPGFANALVELDEQLETIFSHMSKDDLFIITADHGNDPTHPGTDHTREHVPLLVTNREIFDSKRGADLGLRKTFADVGATLASYFDVGSLESGLSFLSEINLTKK